MVEALPPGLTVKQAANVFGRSATLIRRRLHAFGYKAQEVRSPQVPKWANRLNWKRSNVELAEQADVSRERIRQVRAMLGHPRVDRRGKRRV